MECETNSLNLITVFPHIVSAETILFEFGNPKVTVHNRDVTTEATGATEVAPKFSDALTLSRPRGADSAHHRRGRS